MASVTVFVLETTGIADPPEVVTTPLLAPALSEPPPPFPFTWASSRAYRCSPATLVPEPGTALSRVCMSTVSLPGSVMYVVVSR